MDTRISVRKSTRVIPRPFLKWAGGKQQILPELMERVKDAGPFGQYHEPFLGGGALYFELYRTGRLEGKAAVLSDANERLMETYRVVANKLDDLIPLLKMHRSRNCKEYFYKVRDNVPESTVARAARIIYLNRTCFNGLYRENSKGLFNVPYGKYTNPVICDEPNLRACAEALQKAAIDAGPFESVLDTAQAGDFVYMDPPYFPLSRTSNFTSYAKDGFREPDQVRLADVFSELDQRGVHVLLSNSHVPLILDLYKDYHIDIVQAKRAVNSKGDKRGKISEVLVRNF